MPSNDKWNIKAPAAACCASGQDFSDGEEFYAAIFEAPGEEDGFERRDYCAEAWQALLADSQSPRPYSHWRATFEVTPDPRHARKDVVEKESAEMLLRRLIEEDEPSSENARYILALMLERKKLLRQVDAKDSDEYRMLFYEHLKTGETFIVRDPLLKLAEIDQVQAEVASWLGGGDDAEAGAEPDGESPAETEGQEVPG